jgi:hypothetical protein
VQEAEDFTKRGVIGTKKFLDEALAASKWVSLAILGVVVLYVFHETRG